MEITSELVAEGTEPERREQCYRGCTVREPPVVPRGWNRRSCTKVALMEGQNVGGAEMRQGLWGLPSLQKVVGKPGLYSGIRSLRKKTCGSN